MALNRREFIGGTVVVAATARVMQGLAPASGSPSQKGGQWIRKGLIDAGGSNEPYIFVVRRGGQRLDAGETIKHEQSEALLRQLHDNGVEVFHTHLFKGFGMKTEWEEMEETRKAVAFAHSIGMKADTYIQWNSMMYETFFAEEPKATNWIQRDIAGLPILLPYGYQQSFRYCPCFSNQEYIDYLKKVVRYAIVEVKTDFIHFDNFGLNSEPDSCHCPACVAGFRKRLKAKYSPARLKERFGFENVDYVNPPQWNRDNPPEKMQTIYDPAFQEWIDYRCQVMADALRQMYEYSLSLNADVALEINPGGLTGQNTAWELGTDHSRLLPFTQAFWSEEGNNPGYLPDGRLISRIRSYKLARAYSNILLTYVVNDRLALAEDLAFNQTLGMIGTDPITPTTKGYIDFYRKHRDLYAGSEDAANVAIYRSYSSLTNNNAVTQLCAILVEQTLIQSKVPFSYLFDDGLENLAKYKTIILPDSECLSDDQISMLRRYVDEGGGLVVIGQAGLYDEWRRVRVAPGLKGLVDNQEAALDYQEEVVFSAVAAKPGTKKQVGRGKVAYLAALEFDGAIPPHQEYFAIRNEFWKRPKNWQDLIDLIYWTAGNQTVLLVDGPEYLVGNSTIQPDKRRMFVHLVNYKAGKDSMLHSIRVSVDLPALEKARSVTAYAPFTDEVEKIEFTSDGSRTAFVVPKLETYALIAIEW